MVSRKLPQAHPAALKESRTAWKPLAALLAGGAVLSSLTVIAILAVVSQLSGISLGFFIRLARVLDSIVAAVLAGGSAVIRIGVDVSAGLAKATAGFAPILLGAVIVNVVIVAIALLMWRWRFRTTTTCLI